jgi:polyisoprenoid-binding protein YceI
METVKKSTWVLDPVHSELTFKVKHMMISNVKGEFKNFSINVIGEDIMKSTINATIDTSSINTNNTDRDNHLKSGDFFDVEKYKEISFVSSSINQKNDDEYEIKGTLTIKGISQDLALEVEFGGINKDPWGNEKAGLSFQGKINRKDWGLNWNTALETGGVLVSDEVRIYGEFQFVKQS